MYSPGTIAHLQKASFKINKNDAIAKAYENFSKTSDAIRHLKTFRIISNEIPVLLLILCC